MRTAWLALILGLLVGALILIQSARWLIEDYVAGLSSPAVDPLVGTWEIVWDGGTQYEERVVVVANRITLRRFGAYVTNDRRVTFRDNEACVHVGEVTPSFSQALGLYGGCRSEPDWVGSWEATRIQ